jgi:hypothetical protein
MKLLDGQTLDLDQTNAMIVTIIAVDAFADAYDQTQASEDLGREAVGIVLMFEAIMRRVKGQLPQTEKLAHVHHAIAQVEKTAKVIRERYGLPDVV